jgi:teichuronic acid biosynthesis protein TuaE
MENSTADSMLNNFAVLALSLIMGIITAFFPFQLIFIFLGIAYIIAGFIFPKHLFIASVLGLSIELYSINDWSLHNINLDSVQKLLILIPTFTYIFRFGFRKKILYYLLIPHSMMFILSYFNTAKELSLIALESSTALISFLLGWLVLNIRIKYSEVMTWVDSICWLGIISALVGLILNICGIHDMFSYEFDDSIRLAGASIPSHLAMFGFLGLLSSIFGIVTYEGAKTPKKYIIFTIVNTLLIFATITRVAIVLSVLLILGFLLERVHYCLSRRKSIIVYFISFFIIIGALTSVFWPQIALRNLPNAMDNQFINTSNRMNAWRFFFTKVNERLILGTGLGSIKNMNTADLKGNFKAPHNEYLKYLLEGGIAGFTLLILGFVLTFRSGIKKYMLPRHKYYLKLFIFAFVIYSFTDNTISAAQFWIPFMLFWGVVDQKGEYQKIGIGAGKCYQ